MDHHEYEVEAAGGPHGVVVGHVEEGHREAVGEYHELVKVEVHH